MRQLSFDNMTGTMLSGCFFTISALHFVPHYLLLVIFAESFCLCPLQTLPEKTTAGANIVLAAPEHLPITEHDRWATNDDGTVLLSQLTASFCLTRGTRCYIMLGTVNLMVANSCLRCARIFVFSRQINILVLFSRNVL